MALANPLSDRSISHLRLEKFVLFSHQSISTLLNLILSRSFNSHFTRVKDGAACLSPTWHVRLVASSDSLTRALPSL